jgi:hypothetical protein
MTKAIVKDPRDEPRRPVAFPALIHYEAGQPPVQCTVTGIAEKAAQLLIPGGKPVPDNFTLSFGSDTKVHRRCTVLSRETDQIIVAMSR